MDLDFFKDKRVFITGHTGFKGSWLTKILINHGANVRGFSLEPQEDVSLFNILQLEKKVDHINGDIRNQKILEEAMKDFSPEIVFHLAAQAFVRYSYEDPKETYETNVIGSLNLLNAVKECSSVKSVIYVTSDKCYENVEWVYGYREDDMLGGYDPYSSSKACAEILFSSYCRSFFAKRDIGIASVRAGNVIGGGDFSSDRIVPDFINSIKNNRPIVLRNPNATRPWQHVLEPISGYVKLSRELYDKPLNQPSSWNFGPTPQEVYTVEELTSILIDLIGSGSIKIDPKNITLHEAQLLKLNCDKANHILSWYPRWSVKKTIQVTADWYKVYLERGDLEEITDIQINDYFYT